jgi:DNA polymerase III alpha subunit
MIDADWLTILLQVLVNINSTASKALISCGSFDYFKKYRTEMLFEYDIAVSLTKKEIEKLLAIKQATQTKSFIDLLGVGISQNIGNKKRIEVLTNLYNSLKNPPYSTKDKIEWLSDSENSLLGVSITCSKLDSYDIEMTNTDCKTFKNSGYSNNNIIIAGEIANINVVKTKNGKSPGQEMAFVSIEDQTGMIDSLIMFPEKWTEFKSHLYVGNILIFVGNKAKSKDGLIVEKCFVPKS